MLQNKEAKRSSTAAVAEQRNKTLKSGLKKGFAISVNTARVGKNVRLFK